MMHEEFTMQPPVVADHALRAMMERALHLSLQSYVEIRTRLIDGLSGAFRLAASSVECGSLQRT